MIRPLVDRIKNWQLWLVLLVSANAAYRTNNIIGWTITLCFFLFIPGYLLFNLITGDVKSRWEIASFSLGLSILILMLSGLLLNSLHAFGLSRPLTTLNVFIILDTVTLILIVLNRGRLFHIPNLRLRFSKQQALLVGALTLLPLLAIGGAIRLNNGASGVLTMILFALISALLVSLILLKKTAPLYPYAILMMGLSVLLTTSLRGWFITGHDIRLEFQVFQDTSSQAFWSISSHQGNSYNACLSITILPTLLDKITKISAPYIFKVVFQIIFAAGLLPIYFAIKKLSNPRKAFIGAFIFISFPTFIDDMPFLNRQEIAFVFFGLLVLTTFIDLAKRSKTILTILCLLGVMLSHYSSSYITLGLLLLAGAFYWLMSRKKNISKVTYLPLLSLPIIFTALLFTFLWNSQITTSTSNIKHAVTETVKSALGQYSNQPGEVRYSLLGPTTTSPSQAFISYAQNDLNTVSYITPPNLPITSLGKLISRLVNVENFNSSTHAWAVKLFQFLVILGIVIIFFKQRKNASSSWIYFYALCLACLVLLALFTLVPALSSADYNILRLFQQTLIILSLPIIIALEATFGFLHENKMFFIAAYFSVLFLDLSGFIPQATGGFSPQLSLNNSGQYYDFLYTHKSDVLGLQWLATHRSNKLLVHADTLSSAPPLDFPVQTGLINAGVKSGYLYQFYTDVQKGVYRVDLDGSYIEYSDPNLTVNHNLIYSSQGSRIYVQQ